MNINLPSTATPFCVNYGNIDANGDADLLSTQSVVFPNQKEDKITLTSGTIKSAVSGNNYYIGGDPDVVTASNIENIFRSSGGACEVWFSYNYSAWQKRTIAEMTFNEPIELSTLGSVLQAQVYEYNYYFHRPGYEQYYAKTWFEINLYFDDNTMITLPDSKSFSGTNVWKTISYNLSSYANSGKKVIKIQINWWGYMYNHCYGSWQWWYEVRSYVKNVRIINTINSIQYSSNQVDFKIGSNYYKQLSANSNAMLSVETGTITSSNKVFNNIWFQESLVEIPSYIDIFSSTFEFSETPDETSNARLVLRYLDEENNKILGGISINVEYWGGVTYNLVSELVLDRSQDLIYSIPDGKYLKKITVSASQMDYLNRVKIGRIQIYNNVSSSTLSSLAQYPAIQATAADTDRTTYTLMNADSLVTDTSGYLMMSQSGIYLLPGTNVIRKQKNRPTVNDDPQLTDGDVWLDYSKEPLIAYQYHNGKWEIFQDIPIGYVTIDEGTVSNLETYEYNQNGYNINTFTDISGALSGRDGRDGQNGKDGKNGAPGPQGPAGVGIPTGGTTGQILAKASNANYVTKWTNMVSNALFDGGQAGMTLIKNSSDDLDFSWGNIQVLPMGGTSGQALVKNSSTNYDASWQSLHEIPNGGSTNQVLTKLSNSDQDVAWMNPSGGVSQASLNKMDFKTSMYFKASVDGYTNLLLEQFIGLDGVNATDRPTVLTYFNALDDVIENISGETLTFRLVEMSFSQAINYMELEADYTGTVTFKYSTDSGTTYVNFPEDQMLQVTTSTLILKIEMATGANLGNVAIFVK